MAGLFAGDVLMSKQRQALQLAFEALNTSVFDLHDAWRGLTYAENKLRELQAKASDAIREALAEPEQEPVAWTDTDYTTLYVSQDIAVAENANIALYTAPPARNPLTDEQITAIVQSMSAYTWDVYMLARAIERAHGIGGE